MGDENRVCERLNSGNLQEELSRNDADSRPIDERHEFVGAVVVDAAQKEEQENWHEKLR